MPRKDIYKDGVKTRFSPANPPKNPGRRPNVFARYIRENRVSLDDIRALISSMLGYSEEEIQAVLESKKDKPPMGVKLLFKAIQADREKGEISNLEKLMDRAFGKPEKTINHEIGVISPETVALLDSVFTEKPGQTKRGRKPKASGGKPGNAED